MLDVTARAGRIFPAHALLDSAEPLVRYRVNVSNTGTMDAEDVVLGMLVPPGAGEGGVPLQQLFGFEKVHVNAGETVAVDLYPSLADFTQVDTHGVRSARAGSYKFVFGLEESKGLLMGHAEHSVWLE
jgi:xylan 1,4-beta-xylosidase